MKEFKPVKLRMKYDSMDLKAGDEVTAKSDAELRSLCGRGAQHVEHLEEDKQRKEADKKASEKKSKEAKAKKEKEARAKAEKDAKARKDAEEKEKSSNKD